MQLERVVDQLSDRFPEASSMLAEAGADVLALTGIPGLIGSRCGPTTPRNVCTKRSGAGPTSWTSSRTGRQCVGSSVRYSLNSTTTGQWVVDT